RVDLRVAVLRPVEAVFVGVGREEARLVGIEAQAAEAGDVALEVVALSEPLDQRPVLFGPRVRLDADRLEILLRGRDVLLERTAAGGPEREAEALAVFRPNAVGSALLPARLVEERLGLLRVVGVARSDLVGHVGPRRRW